MSGCGSLKVCGWLAGASVRAARCGLVQSGRAACAQPVPRMRSSTESYPARHRPRRDDRRHRAKSAYLLCGFIRWIAPCPARDLAQKAPISSDAQCCASWRSTRRWASRPPRCARRDRRSWPAVRRPRLCCWTLAPAHFLQTPRSCSTPQGPLWPQESRQLGTLRLRRQQRTPAGSTGARGWGTALRHQPASPHDSAWTLTLLPGLVVSAAWLSSRLSSSSRVSTTRSRAWAWRRPGARPSSVSPSVSPRPLLPLPCRWPPRHRSSARSAAVELHLLMSA